MIRTSVTRRNFYQYGYELTFTTCDQIDLLLITENFLGYHKRYSSLGTRAISVYRS